MTTPPFPERTRTFSWDDPLTVASGARGRTGREFLEAMLRSELPPPPVAKALDMSLELVDDRRAVFSLAPAEYHYNPLGSVHGGVITTLCDSAMTCAILSALPAGVSTTTLELKVNFLRPLRAGGRVICEGLVIHLGGRTATAESRVTDESGRLYAHATTTCLILRPD